MATTYTLKSINSDSETCEQCGKTGLKRVMWLAELDEDGMEIGELAMGTTCGARALGLTGDYSNPEQVATVMMQKAKMDEAIENATKMAAKFDDEIAIVRSGYGDGYSTVRGRAYDANPNRYGSVVRWIS